MHYQKFLYCRIAWCRNDKASHCLYTTIESLGINFIKLSYGGMEGPGEISVAKLHAPPCLFESVSQ